MDLLCPACKSVLEEKPGDWWRCDKCKNWLPGAHVRVHNPGAIAKGRPRKETKIRKRGRKPLAFRPQNDTIVVETVAEVQEVSVPTEGGQTVGVRMRGKRRPKGCEED